MTPTRGNGADQQLFQTLEEIRDHNARLIRHSEEHSRGMAAIGEAIRDSNDRLLDVLQNKTPPGYVPMKTHIVSLLVIAGLLNAGVIGNGILDLIKWFK